MADGLVKDGCHVAAAVVVVGGGGVVVGVDVIRQSVWCMWCVF